MTNIPTDQQILDAIEAENDFLAHVLIVKQSGFHTYGKTPELHVWTLGPLEGQKAITEWMQAKPAPKPNQIVTTLDAYEYLSGQWASQPNARYAETDLNQMRKSDLIDLARKWQHEDNAAPKRDGQ